MSGRRFAVHRSLPTQQNNAYEGVLHLQTNSKLMFYKETGDKREIIK